MANVGRYRPRRYYSKRRSYYRSPYRKYGRRQSSAGLKSVIILGLCAVVFGVALGGGFFDDAINKVLLLTNTALQIDTVPPTTNPVTVPTPTPKTVPRNDKSNFDPKLIETYIYEITNKERTSRNLQPLDRHDVIDKIAYEHSMDMAIRDFFSHYNPDGSDPTDRSNKEGLNTNNIGCYYIGLAENIVLSSTYSHSTHSYTTTYAWYGGEQEMAELLMDIWMNSPGHRENILTNDYSYIGIGAYIHDREIFATQNFC